MKEIVLAHSELTNTIYALIGKEKIDITEQAIAEVKAIKALEQEPCEDMERKIEKEYLFESLCEDLKKLQAENENLRKALEQEICEDCISRQAVDELSKELVHTTRDKADFLCNFWEGLRKLPSVKPQEPKTDTWSIKEVTKALEKHGFGRLEQEPKIEWIPVSEKLPEKNMPCLVASGKLCLTQIAMYSDLMGTINRRIFYQGSYGKDDFRDITQYVKAWMPLPMPYKESEVEE